MKTVKLIAPNYRHYESAANCKCCGKPLSGLFFSEMGPLHPDEYYVQATCENEACNVYGCTFSTEPERYAALDTSKYTGISQMARSMWKGGA